MRKVIGSSPKLFILDSHVLEGTAKEENISIITHSRGRLCYVLG